ncbi:MAG: hypothetical protein UT01_C0058G0009 [Candidatus Daviesbacteria bacterium GW2011_GWA1_38_7]|nr:MAG: hypothetical protein UT01_C0058G0009 [Candidatus Daviesbacteria bacterium GW2011_GWA1_38_7]OGE23430.1 MAG: hypothetical protein A2688_02320 [Candidatus Daviesbacteria bacterium RIFCSPHIGHO2_01_FULL_38_8]
MEKRPLRVSFTGIDGAGKSTVAGILEQTLGQSHNLIKLHEIADQTRNTRLIGLASAMSVFTLTRLASPFFESRYDLDLVMSNRDFWVDP